ncbi:4-(cytidine 5'-diphospho)-2-C-methyl-D-erythritol kinase [Methylocapsa sp. D3K7]|uniref:4-(cytidine 5'-diphospho)-2-C-methyl-D-erythritol kinase n=1 Tax=Methylocapsa sp. D3K7 TaxID=3041435 RepID=UPI00244EDD1D|nr:4-(cytidine 5'-diphospho)-2-C-methyl-D-erythritol kinase [Methylocapsa sp. D3K7]WGJ16483.1 4-(cytidine 5'-diphospho)-2-C-methyl-D-erythritol kinase [Methylocapsa sp. D3K7]
MLTERAPAKINLTLHIVGRRADGYHNLESLVAFSRGGDTLSLTPGNPLSLSIEGPAAEASGRVEDNLVLRAAAHFVKRFPGAKLGAFHLVKRLPVAAGLGGGSSDAAAALRLLARANALSLEDPLLFELAKATGADVPVCLLRRARIMRGVGDELGPLLALPPLMGLLVNPGHPVETKAVFARMKIAPGVPTGFGGHPELVPDMSASTLLAALHKGRNDMEAAACLLAPIISDVLSVLSAAPGCRLSRMSGSGATCFALFKDCRSAARAKKAILQAHPHWWAKVSVLG